MLRPYRHPRDFPSNNFPNLVLSFEDFFAAMQAPGNVECLRIGARSWRVGSQITSRSDQRVSRGGGGPPPPQMAKGRPPPVGGMGNSLFADPRVAPGGE